MPGTRADAWRAWAGAALVAVLGCAEPGDPGPRVREQVEPDTTARRSDAIVISLPQLPRKFDPLDDMEPWASRIADDLVFEGLVRRDREAAPWAELAIADACVIDPDYDVTMITCHIPRGILFHDGSELGMDDVEYSLHDWLQDRHSSRRHRFGLSSFTRLELADGPRNATPEQRDHRRWIRMVWDKREPLALESLAALKIVPVGAHRGHRDRFARAPIGTGPMRMTTLTPDRIVLERWDGYRTPRPDAPDELGFRAIDDGAVALTALRRGEIHLLAEVAADHVPVELGRPGMAERFRAWVVSPASYDVLLWYLGKGVSANLELREALHAAVPRAAIARTIYASPGIEVEAPVDLHEPAAIDLDALTDIKLGEPIGPVGATLPHYPAIDDDRLGASQAAAALDRLGWTAKPRFRRRSGGGWLRINLARDDHDGLPRSISEAIRGAWQAIGVRSPDSANPWRFLFAMLSKGKFRVALVRLAGPSDEDLSPRFHSRGALNFAGVDDDELDLALREYVDAQTRQARDAAKQHIAARIAELRVVTVNPCAGPRDPRQSPAGRAGVDRRPPAARHAPARGLRAR